MVGDIPAKHRYAELHVAPCLCDQTAGISCAECFSRCLPDCRCGHNFATLFPAFILQCLGSILGKQNIVKHGYCKSLRTCMTWRNKNVSRATRGCCSLCDRKNFLFLCDACPKKFAIQQCQKSPVKKLDYADDVVKRSSKALVERQLFPAKPPLYHKN